MEAYDWDTIQEAESQAKRWALRQFFTRDRGRLFSYPEMDLRDERARYYLEDELWRQPVAVMSSGSEEPLVGIFWGFNQGFGNLLYVIEYVIGHFGGPGTTTRGSHMNIIDMLRLPPGFDTFIPRDEEDESEALAA